MWCFVFNDTATTEIYTLSLHDALPRLRVVGDVADVGAEVDGASHDPERTSLRRSDTSSSELRWLAIAARSSSVSSASRRRSGLRERSDGASSCWRSCASRSAAVLNTRRLRPWTP